MIVYVGNNEIGAFAFKAEVVHLGETFLKCEGEDAPFLLKEKTEQLIQLAANLYIYDLTSLDGSEESITKEVQHIRQATDSRVVIYAPGYLEDSRILNSFRALGMDAIILEACNLGKLQEQLRSYITESYHSITAEESERFIENREETFEKILQANPHLERVEKESGNTGFIPSVEGKPIPEIKRKELCKKRGGVKIAVVGSKREIGTTTLAIQLIKFLNGREDGCAAYLEYNNTGYVERLRNTYILDEERTENDCILFRNVEIYYNPRKMPEILSQGYDYLVYDYGSIEDLNELLSVFEKDLILLVGGAKPNSNEINKMTNAMRSVFDQKNVFYLFNHVHPHIRNDVLKAQGEKSNRTYFMEYAPEPFLYNAEYDAIFLEILQSDYEKVDVTQGKRKRLSRLFQK